jgi:hypothetical protein
MNSVDAGWSLVTHAHRRRIIDSSPAATASGALMPMHRSLVDGTRLARGQGLPQGLGEAAGGVSSWRGTSSHLRENSAENFQKNFACPQDRDCVPASDRINCVMCRPPFGDADGNCVRCDCAGGNPGSSTYPITILGSARANERTVSIRRGPPGWSFLPVPTVEQGGIVFIHLDQLDEVFDAEVGERHDAVFSDPVDPDNPILDFHFIGDVRQPVFAFAEILGDAMDGGDMMDLVDVHDQAA